MIIKRKEYLDQLIALKDKKIIKIITGVRRCGKSTLMQIFQEYLLQNGVKEENIIAIDFEDSDYNEIHDNLKLYEYIKSKLDSKKHNYIFLDEIQNIKDFPKVVDSLYIKDNVDIYITSSNTYMFNSETATLISGRFIEIRMLPLSFAEYVETTGDKKELQRKYTDYIKNSSFPYTLKFKDKVKEIAPYLDSVYNTIVVKDIASWINIQDIAMLQSITRFVFDNIGNPLSNNKIADTMTSLGRKIDVKTVEKYIDGLLESFILYKANRYDIKGKQYLKTLGKYYVVDIGLRYMLLGRRSTDIGHILENVVYLELLRRGYEVYVGKVDKLEVDFVAIDNNEILYFQVAASVRDEKTLERELKPLKSIDDHYAKFVLTLDEDPEVDYNGIRKINVLDWLLDK